MINKELLARRKKLTKIEGIDELEGVYIRTLTVKDLKIVNKIDDEMDKTAVTIQLICVDIEGKSVFTEEDVNNLTVDLLQEISEQIAKASKIGEVK